MERGAGVIPAPAPAAEAGPSTDYLSFLLDELLWERRWGTRGGLAALERMLNRELDRWGLDESQEIWLAATLAERHGLELPEPQ